jgi:hypothetical protein
VFCASLCYLAHVTLFAVHNFHRWNVRGPADNQFNPQLEQTDYLNTIVSVAGVLFALGVVLFFGLAITYSEYPLVDEAGIPHTTPPCLLFTDEHSKPIAQHLHCAVIANSCCRKPRKRNATRGVLRILFHEVAWYIIAILLMMAICIGAIVYIGRFNTGVSYTGRLIDALTLPFLCQF